MKLSVTYKDNCESLRARGFASIAAMGEYFERACDVDVALGFTNAASAWFYRGEKPSRDSEMKAAAWLRENMAASGQTEPDLPFQDVAEKTGEMLLVIFPNDQVKRKAVKVLGILGCEVVDV